MYIFSGPDFCHHRCRCRAAADTETFVFCTVLSFTVTAPSLLLLLLHHCGAALMDISPNIEHTNVEIAKAW